MLVLSQLRISRTADYQLIVQTRLICKRVRLYMCTSPNCSVCQAHTWVVPQLKIKFDLHKPRRPVDMERKNKGIGFCSDNRLITSSSFLRENPWSVFWNYVSLLLTPLLFCLPESCYSMRFLCLLWCEGYCVWINVFKNTLSSCGHWKRSWWMVLLVSYPIKMMYDFT